MSKTTKVDFIKSFIAANTKDDAKDLESKAATTYRNLAKDVRTAYMTANIDLENAQEELTRSKENYEATKFSQGVTLKALVACQTEIKQNTDRVARQEAFIQAIKDEAASLGIDPEKTVG